MPERIGVKPSMSAGQLYDLRTAGIDADRVAINKMVAGLRTLEVGCGTGRVLKWLVGQGAECVVGIDLDDEKLAVARCKPELRDADELVLEHADFLSFHTSIRFECVLFAFNVLAEFIGVDEKINAVRRALDCLDVGGKIVIINSIHDFASFSQNIVTHRFEIPSSAGVWDADLVCRREQVQQQSRCEISYVCRDTGRRVSDQWQSSLVTRNELLAIYCAAGVNNVIEYGSYELGALTSESEILIHVLHAN